MYAASFPAESVCTLVFFRCVWYSVAVKKPERSLPMGKKTGARIKEARTEAGLTQEQLAKKIAGLSASDISKAERGELELTQAILKEIARQTGVTQTSLLNAEKPAAKKTSAKSSTAKKSTAKIKDDMDLTASEKKLVELYRAADSDTRKAAVSLLKGEKNDIQELLGSLLGDTLKNFLK